MPPRDRGGDRDATRGVAGKQTLPIESESEVQGTPGKQSLAEQAAPGRRGKQSLAEQAAPGRRIASALSGAHEDGSSHAIPRLQLGDVPAGKRERVQVQAHDQNSAGPPIEVARSAMQGPGSEIPFASTIQRSFGRHDISGVRAHGDAAAARGARQLGARALASGEDVAFDGAPSLHIAAHEAAHVVQQRGGAAGAQGLGRADAADEAHADAVADRVVRGESAEQLLDARAGDRTARAAARGVHLLRIEPDDQGRDAKRDVGDFSPAERFRRDHASGYDTDALSHDDLVRLRGILRDGTYRLVNHGLQARLVAAVDARLAALAPAPARLDGAEVKDSGRSPAPSGIGHGADAKRGSGALDPSQLRLSQVLAGSVPAPDAPAIATARTDLNAVEAKLDTPASSVAQGGGRLASAVSAIYALGGYAAWLGVGRLFLEPILKLAIRRIFGVDVPRLDLSFGMGFARVEALELGTIARGGVNIGGVELKSVGFRFDAEALDRAFRALDPSLLGQGMIVVDIDSVRVRDLRLVRNTTPLAIQVTMQRARFLASHANLLDDLAQIAESAFAEQIDPATVERGLQRLLRDHLQGAFQIGALDVAIDGDLQRAVTGQGEPAEAKQTPPRVTARIRGLHGAAVGQGSREDRPEAQIGFTSANLSASSVPVRHGDTFGRVNGSVAFGPTTVVHAGAVRPQPHALAPQAGGAAATAVSTEAVTAEGVALGGSGPHALLDRLEIGASRGELVAGESAHMGLGGLSARGAHYSARNNVRDGDFTTRQEDSADLTSLTVFPLGMEAKRDRAGEHLTVRGGGGQLRGASAARSIATHPVDEKHVGRPLTRDAAHADVGQLDVGALSAEVHRGGNGESVGAVDLASLGMVAANGALESDLGDEHSRHSAGIRSLRLSDVHAGGTQDGLQVQEAHGHLGHLDARGLTGQAPGGRASLDRAVLEGARGAFAAANRERKEPVGPSGRLQLGRLGLDRVSAQEGERQVNVGHLGVTPTSVVHTPTHSQAHLGAISASNVALGARSHVRAEGATTHLHDRLRLRTLDVAALDASSDAKGATRRSRLDGGAMTLHGLRVGRNREVTTDDKDDSYISYRDRDRLGIEELRTDSLHARLNGSDRGSTAQVGIDGAYARGVSATGARAPALFEPTRTGPKLTAAEMKLGGVEAHAGPDDPRLHMGGLDVRGLDVRTESGTLAARRLNLGETRATLGADGLDVRQGGVRAERLEASTADPGIDAERLTTMQLDVSRLRSAEAKLGPMSAGVGVTQRGLSAQGVHYNERTADMKGSAVTDLTLGDAKLDGATLATDRDRRALATPGAVSASNGQYRSEANGTIEAELGVNLELGSNGDGSATVRGHAVLPTVGDKKLDLRLPIHAGRVALGDVRSGLNTGWVLWAGKHATNLRISRDKPGREPELRVSVAKKRVVTKTLADLGITPEQQASIPVLRPDSSGGQVDLLTLIMHRVQNLVTNALGKEPPNPPSTLADYKERKLAAKIRALIARLHGGDTMQQTGARLEGVHITSRTASRDAKDPAPKHADVKDPAPKHADVKDPAPNPASAEDRSDRDAAAFSETLRVIVDNLELDPTAVLTRLGVDPEVPSPHAMTVLAILEDLSRTLDDVLRGTPSP